MDFSASRPALAGGPHSLISFGGACTMRGVQHPYGACSTKGGIGGMVSRLLHGATRLLHGVVHVCCTGVFRIDG
jgi:hypothetical protein